MKILGADLARGGVAGQPGDSSLVALDDAGAVADARHPATVPAFAEAIGAAAGDEPFLIAVNLPIVSPRKTTRARPVENLVRRRLGHRLRPRGGPAAERAAAAGEGLLAGLAAAGHPCLPYPDRDRRRSGLAEIHPELVLKALLWENSAVAHATTRRDELFKAFAAPGYRLADSPKRAGWADRGAALDTLMQALRPIEGYDFRQAREALLQAGSSRDVERAASLFDAALLAGTARRYLEAPEACLFLGDRDHGYVILPADGFVRRLARRGETRPRSSELFPRASLRDRLGDDADLRPVALVSLEGQPQQFEASFQKEPFYEFDNLDEMLWWKHCRHLSGPTLPTEGLRELTVVLGPEPAAAGRSVAPLRLSRSRHRTLSFRFDPPETWRASLPTRDGKTYPFRVLRAVYETLPAAAG